jgi:hypothetical protein
MSVYLGPVHHQFREISFEACKENPTLRYGCSKAANLSLNNYIKFQELDGSSSVHGYKFPGIEKRYISWHLTDLRTSQAFQ